MYIIKQTDIFKYWLKNVKDPIARVLITKRIEQARQGHFGDYKMLGGGLSEMRIDTGQGYRIYYAKIDKTIYLLLNGGNKSSQKNDIIQAKLMLIEIEKEGESA